MKTFKILFAAVIIAGFATSAMAQQSDNDNVAANAEVLAPIEVTGAENLEFEIVSPGIPKTVNLDGTAEGGTITENEQAARFDITAGNSANVTLSFTSIPGTLANGEESLPISYIAAWGTASDYAETFEPVNVTENQPTEATTSESGEIYVFLGGTVTPDAAQAQGNYTADITLTVTYN